MTTAIAAILVQVALLIAGSYVAGRLLGIRVTWGRWVIALGTGLVLGGIVGWLAAGRPPDGAGIDRTVIAVATLTITLTAVADPFGFAGPPGRLARISAVVTRVPHAWRGVRDWLVRSRRYAQVVRIAARHGLLDRTADPIGQSGSAAAHERRMRRIGRALRHTLDDAGGAFVKLGQVLSTRPDLLPTAITDELAGLTDDVAPAAADQIAALLTDELGAAPSQVFAEFDTDPIAAASIAQVHRAWLRSGEVVAVKIQRPEVRGIVARDLDIARRLADAIEQRADWGRDVGVRDLADGFADALSEELDFRVEARNTAVCRAALEPTAIVRIPEVHETLSSDRVLVLEWMDGVAVRAAGPLIARHGLDRSALARELLSVVLRQVLVDGVFHADPHPGNVLIRADGTLALIDFGSVGRLDALQQAALLRAMLAVDRRDPRQMRDALVDIARPRSTVNEDLLEAALGQFLVGRLGEGMPADPALFVDLLRLTLDFGLAFPPHVAAVFRTLVTLDGTLRTLDPAFSILDQAKAATADLGVSAVEPDELANAVAHEALALLPLLRRLPRRIDRIAHAAEQGTLAVNVRLLADHRDVTIVTALVHRALLAFVAAALGLVSAHMLSVAGSTSGALGLVGASGLIVSGILGLRALIEILRPPP